MKRVIAYTIMLEMVLLTLLTLLNSNQAFAYTRISRDLFVKGNNIFVSLAVNTTSEITFYEIIPNNCAVGEHGNLIKNKNVLYYKVNATNQVFNYELFCNYGNYTIHGYYTKGSETIQYKNSSFFVEKVSVKPIPTVLWIVLLLILVLFFIVTLLHEPS